MTDSRRLFCVTGADRIGFLQGLVTCDMRHLEAGPLYGALLTPQGKYLADFLLVAQGGGVLLDVAAPLAEALVARLGMYRLRAAVAIAPAPLHVSRGTGPPPEGARPDPRHPALGWRLYGPKRPPDTTDWDALRVAHCIPESLIELIPDKTYILEAGFERLHGVDFRKGCYVGQEVTARMKHKTTLKKGLVTVEIEGAAPVGTPIMAQGKAAGTLYTQAAGQAIAQLRFERALDGETAGGMRAGDAVVRWKGKAGGLLT